MKSVISLAIVAAAGVSAQMTSSAIVMDTSAPTPVPTSGGDSDCGAEYIVRRCLQTEQAKAEACEADDYDCQCAAYQAIATCYNNCPNDPRAGPAQGQVSIYCKNASLYGSSAKATKTATDSATTMVMEPSSTSSSDIFDDLPSNTASFSAEAPTSTGAASELVANTGSIMVAFLGALAAML